MDIKILRTILPDRGLFVNVRTK